ncbi:MAG TPA: hypothetical protein PKJ37_02345 [Acidobacteriota bacterium]|nr:hypothetical protein [Acidobacteriota bacterium]
MKIRNINGTSQNTCKCGSWLNHWKTYSHQEIPGRCPVQNCPERVLVGAHVQKADSDDNAWYIYPLCKGHNASTGHTLEVSDSYRLVSANIAGTCG